MAKQQIKRFKKFGEVPGMDKELDLIVKQIQDQIGVMDPALGEVYIDQDPAVTITITTPGTYYLIDGMKIGVKNKTDVTASGMKLQIAGTYHTTLSTSFTCDVNNTIVHVAIYYNGVIFSKTRMERKIATAGDHGSMSLNGFGVGKTAGLFQLKITADKACDVTINHLNFTITQLLL